MTRRHSRDDPRKDVGVGVGFVECQLDKSAAALTQALCDAAAFVILPDYCARPTVGA